MQRIGGVLGLFAHPDDEEFGTSGALALCADRGIPVTIVSLTNGDAGEISDPALAMPESLGAVREEELRTACRHLGFAEPEFLGYADGHVADGPPEELRDRLVATMRRYRPRVVVTFDANGGYGHPDHIALHHAVVGAWPLSGDAGYRPELGPSHQPDKLYATAYPRSLFARMGADFETYGVSRIEFGDVQTIGDDQLGTADERITTVVEVDQLWDRRWAAFRAHQTQYGANSPFLQVPPDVVRRWMAQDRFVRLVPVPRPGAALPDETDIWQDLPVPVIAGVRSA